MFSKGAKTKKRYIASFDVEIIEEANISSEEFERELLVIGPPDGGLEEEGVKQDK